MDYMNLKIVKTQYPRIIKKYLCLKSCAKVAKIFNVEETTIANIVKSQGLIIKDNNARKYFFNQTLFHAGVKNHSLAYILGLLYADGCNTKGACILSLQERDKYILKKIAKVFHKSGTLLKINKNNPLHQNQFRLELNSKILSNNLKKLGVVAKKSLILKFPTKNIVSKNFMSSFIRGYFDGDGCVYITKENKLRVNITSSTSFCNGASLYLNTLDIKTRFRHYKNSLSKGIEITNNKDCIKFYQYIYQHIDNGLFLIRKKKKFEDWIANNKKGVYP